MIIGAHVSIAGGLDKAIDNGEKLGVDCIQSFASSPRTMKYKPVDDAVIEKYLSKKKEGGIQLHVFHGVYLINLAHENIEYVDVCVDLLVYYQQLAGKIGGLGTVFHVGSHKGKGMDAVASQVSQALKQVLEKSPENVWLMLENTAGQKGSIGRDLAELDRLREGVIHLGGDVSRLGVCVDTQHGHAGGYEISRAGAEALIDEIDNTFGMDKLQLIHVNDSLSEFDSGLDRHANVGEGSIRVANMGNFLSHPSFEQIPLVLEVPGENKSGPRKQDVDELRSLVG